MYKNNLVVTIKHNNKILREHGSEVRLPFGSEYSIFIKNLESRKVSINVSIDGEDVLDNKSILIEPNSSMELDGFMDGMSAKNRFRFIKKTKQISDYRGDRIDDGLVRVEFAYEKISSWFGSTRYPFYSYNTYYSDWDGAYGSARYCSSDAGFTGRIDSDVLLSANMLPEIEDGITVKGEEIDQKFIHGCIGELEDSQVMVIHLCGEKVNGTVVSKPITVKTRIRCKTCGVLSKSSAKFCSNCGTFLE